MKSITASIVLLIWTTTLLMIRCGPTSQWFSSNIFTRFLRPFNLTLAQNVEAFDGVCQWKFLNYTPSPWEYRWILNIGKFQSRVCEHLANTIDLNNTILATKALITLHNFSRINKWNKYERFDELFSQMFYQQICFNPITKISFEKVRVSHAIEPLIGLLRDPLTICPRLRLVPLSLYNGAIVQSKRFLLLSIIAPYYKHIPPTNEVNNFEAQAKLNQIHHNIPSWMYQRSILDSLHFQQFVYQRKTQNILFDLGSSYFKGWNGDESAVASRWFYEHYKRLDIKFDRIIAYEYSPLDSKTAWEMLPDDVLPIYTLINLGVTTSGKLNPWFTLKSIAQTYDHVVVKLDIDNPTIESHLISQVLNDSSIHSLIDELFFEHHVTIAEMQAYWGSPPGRLQDSYFLFTKLRQLGIRAHSWP